MNFILTTCGLSILTNYLKNYGIFPQKVYEYSNLQESEINDKEFLNIPKVIKKDLKMVDFTRYSNRQRKKLKIGGIVGEMIIEGLTFQTYQLLKYGEISGVGKLNSFGLGKIELEDIK